MNKQTDLFKVLLVGDSAVGKTSLFKLYKSNQVDLNLPPTMGCDYHVIDQSVDEKLVKLFVWDTAGQEKYRSIIPQWYRGARGVLLIFSVINRTSFNNVTRWMNDLVNNIEDFSVVIVGNKTDLQSERVVSFEEGEQLGKKFNVPYFETSIFVDKKPSHALKIHDIFLELAREMLKNEKEREKQKKNEEGSFHLGEQQQKIEKKRCRCQNNQENKFKNIF